MKAYVLRRTKQKKTFDIIRKELDIRLGEEISAYKNIVKQNTKKKSGDLLSVSDRKKIAENLNGYDISPEFLKVSLYSLRKSLLKLLNVCSS